MLKHLKLNIEQLYTITHTTFRDCRLCLRTTILETAKCLQSIFQVFLQIMAITLYILSEIIQSSFTGRGDPSELQLNILASFRS